MHAFYFPACRPWYKLFSEIIGSFSVCFLEKSRFPWSISDPTSICWRVPGLFSLLWHQPQWIGISACVFLSKVYIPIGVSQSSFCPLPSNGACWNPSSGPCQLLTITRCDFCLMLLSVTWRRPGLSSGIFSATHTVTFIVCSYATGSLSLLLGDNLWELCYQTFHPKPWFRVPFY